MLRRRLFQIILLSSILSSVMSSLTSDSDSDEDEEDHQPPHQNLIPLCGSQTLKKVQKNILLVTTLDGSLTALDPDLDGAHLWTVSTGPGSMLSSTISQMELTNNAKWVRLIPSLAGGLYKFDGHFVEPVPLSAEELLRTSFKFADNTVMTGGKESRVYGIEMDTGQIRYECTLAGCFGPDGDEKNEKNNDDMEDILVVKRETQTVRAVEPRTGTEKWNFSVSTHSITYQPGLEELCQNDSDQDQDILDHDDLSIKAIVPDGIICKVDKDKPEIVKWKQTFKSPIVHAWTLQGSHLRPVDLFSNKHLPEVKSDHQDKKDPALYIGSYNQQLYIQESDFQRKSLAKDDDKDDFFPPAKVTWRPYLISADSRTRVINHGSEPDLPLLTQHHDSEKNKNALAVLGNDGYPYDSGLYLYPDEANLDYDMIEDITNHTETENVEVEKEEEVETIDIPGQAIQIVFVGLWYWWQEVVIISIITAVIMNVLITRPIVQGMRAKIEQLMRRRPEVVVVERTVAVPYEVQVPVTPDTAGSSGSMMDFASAASLNNAGGEFVSRYLTDYDPVQCLGAGGFGVVFESKNKIDENNYAVKRVRLPRREEARKKVLREVKCVAKLEHRNIVRYFHTWIEYPPSGWEEEVDKWWKTSDEGVSLGGHTTFESSRAVTNPLKPFDCSQSDLNKPQEYSSIISVGDEEDSNIVFSTGSFDQDDESSGGICFKDDSRMNPPPSAILASDETRSKFWKDSITSSEGENAVCEEALEWDQKNEEKKKPHGYLYIVMQLCQKESLRIWLRNCTVQRNRLKSLSMFQEICLGVEYVHSQGLIHRDLKPSNIFFANDGTIKIGDFGLVTVGGTSDDEDGERIMSPSHFGDGQTEQVGTELYMSPEQLAKKPYNHKVDLYSLGLILFEILVPFATQMERLETLTNLRNHLKFPSHFTLQNTQEYGLVKDLLCHEPAQRPEACEILDMQFLKDAALEFGGSNDDFFNGDSRRRKHLSSTGSNNSVKFGTI